MVAMPTAARLTIDHGLSAAGGGQLGGVFGDAGDGFAML